MLELQGHCILDTCARSHTTACGAIIYLSEQAMSRKSQGGYEPDEIEVTPAMIEAGEITLAWLRGSYPDRELAVAVYNAMTAARLQPTLGGWQAAAHAEAVGYRPPAAPR